LADARAGFAIDFTPAVARIEDADRTYRLTIEAVLPPQKAHALLQAMTTFRNNVAELRETTRTQTGYGDFDPLDTYVPAIAASHAHAVRSANVADIARGRLADLRGEVNARLGELLDRAEIERLIEAKRVRNAAFDQAIRHVVPPDTTDQLATTLMLLADGWY
jgi:hypothetical protein